MLFRASRLRVHLQIRLVVLFLFALLALSLVIGALAENRAIEQVEQESSPGQSSASSAGSSFAQDRSQDLKSSDGIWQEVAPPAITNPDDREIVPHAFRTLHLNKQALQQVLDRAPLEFTEAARNTEVVMTLPLAGGKMARFRIEQSPIMAPELAAKFPEIKTYRGQGIDDLSATIRFDVTPVGFHAQVLSAQDTVYVDPYAKGDTENYVTYLKRDFQKDTSFACLVGAGEKDGGMSVAEAQMTVPMTVPAHGATLRNYRLALAATGEYTIAAGGTVPLAVARITTSLNRINGIYERELALRMTLVANNDSLIYTNPATDPYTNSTPSDMMAENQSNLNTVIGLPNYDMGHVFGTGNGGTAPVRSTCKDLFKGQGVTALPNPVGDPFDVDFAAHEMGHQHGGLHTFNTVAGGSCQPGFRTPISAFEPGSGSTPMSYVGTCAPANLQKNADDYFHVRSLEEMVAYMNGDGNCAAQSATGNTPPTVNAGADFTIPRNTPFALTASGSDGNGDPITFAWEEYDLGPNPGGTSPPESDSDGVPRPIFRSYQPTANPTRTFPSLQYILSNANVPPATYSCGLPLPCITGESLPNITRTMNFQVTARDSRAGGGGIVSDIMQVNVTAAAGPFAITQPNTAVSWTGGTPQTVLWDVAGTTAAPVSVATVNILLSTDGGTTFPTIIAAGTANDGTEAITVPNVSTASARIKVEAVGNIFFDISGANFSITPAAAPTLLFSAANYPVTEGTAGVGITVNRSGDTSGVSTVEFATSDSAAGNACSVVNGSASSRCDYLISIGKLTFAAGETSKGITIPIVNDSYAEGSETFTITLTNPVGAALGAPASATITITDNESTNGPNPIDVSGFFVRQHYLDFLSREPDATGLSFWTNVIESCSPQPQCTEVTRINVSAGFIVSIEFLHTGYLVERIYKAAYGDGSGSSTCCPVPAAPHQISVPIVRFSEFLPDSQRIGQGVVVNQPGWELVLESNKQLFATEFVQRSRFITDYPLGMTAAQFVDKLNTNAGNPLSTAERDQLVSDLSSAAKTRAQVLRAVAEDPDLYAAEFNRAFVLMQYFGYLRRNPNDAPDSDYTGYDFWLTKLNQFNGSYINAELVKAFISSLEYRRRFGP